MPLLCATSWQGLLNITVGKERLTQRRTICVMLLHRAQQQATLIYAGNNQGHGFDTDQGSLLLLLFSC